MTTHVLVPRRSALPTVAAGWHDFDRVFDELWSGFGRPFVRDAGSTAWKPRLDLVETDAEIRVDFELPGMEEEDIEVALEDGVLTVRGERKREEERVDSGGVRHRETFHGHFERALRLPAEVDAEAVKAVYRAGILSVTLPKTPEAQVRNIPITS